MREQGFDALFDALAEDRCVGCPAPRHGEGMWARWLCADCAGDVPTALAAVRQAPEGVARAWALGPYAGPLGAMIRHGKYQADARILEALAQVLAAELDHQPIKHDLNAVVAVPSSWWRSMQRGLDPVFHVASPIARSLSRPLQPALTRQHRGPTSRLGRLARAAHHRGVFRAKGQVDGDVLLVDDVCTTGSTASACARELLGAGARRVYLLTVAAVRFS